MAEANQIVFSFHEVVEALLKKQGIHEGVWGLYVEFGIGATNAGPSLDQLNPVAMVPVMKLGIQRVPELSNLSLDAAVVNPIGKKEPVAKLVTT